MISKEEFKNFKERYFALLDKKTGWGKNDVKMVFEVAEELLLNV
jgi:hypothetical protein